MRKAIVHGHANAVRLIEVVATYSGQGEDPSGPPNEAVTLAYGTLCRGSFRAMGPGGRVHR